MFRSSFSLADTHKRTQAEILPWKWIWKVCVWYANSAGIGFHFESLSNEQHKKDRIKIKVDPSYATNSLYIIFRFYWRHVRITLLSDSRCVCKALRKSPKIQETPNGLKCAIQQTDAHTLAHFYNRHTCVWVHWKSLAFNIVGSRSKKPTTKLYLILYQRCAFTTTVRCTCILVIFDDRERSFKYWPLNDRCFVESRSVLRLLLLSPVQLSSMDTYCIYETQFNPFFLAQLFFSILSQNYFRLSLATDARYIWIQRT